MAPLVIPLLFLCAMTAVVLGGLLSQLVPIKPLRALGATVLILASLVAYVGFRDRAFFILEQTRPAERAGDVEQFMFLPGPASRCRGLIAIARRRAAAGRTGEPGGLRRRAAGCLAHGFEPRGHDRRDRHRRDRIRALRSTERDYRGSASEQDRLWFFGNAYLRAGQFERVETSPPG